jgi:hypothetical protein
MCQASRVSTLGVLQKVLRSFSPALVIFVSTGRPLAINSLSGPRRL